VEVPQPGFSILNAELAGQKKAVGIAVRNVSGRRRWSKLDKWLRPIIPGASSATAILSSLE
jgi:hypothetical protein